jgi:16S rRNA (guanine966-N2)-methyltransferase
LFNWLREHLDGARCLDLYAGSGILGFEALSRGAREVWFVERDGALADSIAVHLRALGANGHVVMDAAERFLARPAEPFDIVFLDPPYTLPLEPIIARLPAILRADGLFYIERAARDGLPESALLEWRKTGHAGAVRYGLAALAPPARP